VSRGNNAAIGKEDKRIMKWNERIIGQKKDWNCLGTY
jgi:hypothetical protein